MIYTVDNLLDYLSVVGNNKIWEVIPEGVTVKGVVSNIKPYNQTTSYFDLTGSGKKIRVCCDYNDTPAEGEAIKFSGQVSLKTNNFGTNLQVLLKGDPVGNWKRHKPATVLTTQELVKYNNQPLSSLMGEFSHGHTLVLIGSETAINDVFSSVEENSSITISKINVAVSKKNDVIKAVNRLSHSVEPIAAFAMVRGGDDETMSIWDDPDIVKVLLDVNIPFYTALGHAHRLTLADKYAAQSFPTPSNLANNINNIEKEFVYSQSQVHKINQLTNDLKELNAEAARLRSDDKNNNWRIATIVLLILLVVSLIF